MKHNMKLNDGPYNSIYYGNKDIEMRLYDEKRQLISVGDIIEFTNNETMDKFDAEVVCLHRCNSFEELYDKFDKFRLGYNEDEIAKAEDMQQYYTKEDIDKYGVVGIEICVNRQFRSSKKEKNNL